jgi:hypothetical protein
MGQWNSRGLGLVVWRGGLGMRPARGGRKKNGKTTYVCASSQKEVRTYVLFSFFFLRKGSSKTRETNLSAFPNNSQGKHFFGGDFFPGGFVLLLFLSTFLLLRWLSASR